MICIELFKEEKSVPIFKLTQKTYSKDAQIWDTFRKGNESAFIFIYETHFERLYAYGCRIAPDRSIVKDAIQELFMDLRKNRDKLGNTDSIKFYLFKCLKRKMFKEVAKWQLNRRDWETTSCFDFTISHEQHLIDTQVNEEQRAKLNTAIQNLSPRKKEIIYYFFYEGLEYPQIQEIMGLENLKTTRNLMYKALNFLREVLG